MKALERRIKEILSEMFSVVYVECSGKMDDFGEVGFCFKQYGIQVIPEKRSLITRQSELHS
jgi:hypothetical protein